MPAVQSPLCARAIPQASAPSIAARVDALGVSSSGRAKPQKFVLGQTLVLSLSFLQAVKPTGSLGQAGVEGRQEEFTC